MSKSVPEANMTLPKSTCSFTIPSLHDDLKLDCRLYYPRQKRNIEARKPFQNLFAIVAHPYAPLGGSYDDPVVALVGAVLIGKGYVLGTFNFRGARGSSGRTSWSGKPELADYVSFYGFMLAFLSHVVSSEIGNNPSQELKPPTLILGGYSYGSMIAQSVPMHHVIADILKSATNDSTEIEITRRAEHLAKDFTLFINTSSSLESSVKKSTTLKIDEPNPFGLGVSAIGDYESNAASKRISRESFRKSMDKQKFKKSIDKARSKPESQTEVQDENGDYRMTSTASFEVVHPFTSFLLISPILPPISSFTTFFTRPSFGNKRTGKLQQTSADMLVGHCSCAIYGSKDTFSSHKKLENWAKDLSSRPNSRFSSYTVDGAGHFWHEHDVAAQMQAQIKSWLDQLEVEKQSFNHRSPQP